MQRYRALDGMRGVLALWVALLHLPVEGVVRDIVHNAHLAVDCFFVLSGFVIAHAYAGAIRPGPFLLRRIGRVWPLHVVMLGVLVVLEVVRWSLEQRGLQVGPPAFIDEREPLSIATNALLVHCWGVHDHDTWNGPSWSISVEMLAYIVFALIALVPRPRARVALYLTLAAVGWAVIAWAAPEQMASTYDYGVFRGLLGFFLGVLAYRPARLRGTAAELGCVVLMIALVRLDPLALAAAPVFALSVSVFSAEAGWVSRLLVRPWVQRLGEWSYSIYMVHAVLVVVGLAAGLILGKLLGARLVERSTFVVGAYAPALALGYLVIVVALASQTYRWIEVPCRRWFNARAGRAAR